MFKSKKEEGRTGGKNFKRRKEKGREEEVRVNLERLQKGYRTKPE